MAVVPSPLAARLNAGLDRAWAKEVLTRPSLDPDALMAKVGRELGLGEGWRARLRILCESLENEADLNPLGRTIAHGQIVKLLGERARLTRLWAKRPELLGAPIAKPIVVLGQMRSGTTRLHRLLACDPRFSYTRFLDTMSPAPRGRPNLRVPRVAAGLRFLHALNPALATIHPTSPFAPEEEFGLLAFAFSGAQFEAQWRVPSFARACETGDARDVYAELHRLLRTIRWSRGDAPKPWLLKAPQYMQDLAALLGEFPDARLICLSRNAEAVAASSASLAWQTMRLGSDSADPLWAGREWLRKIRLRQATANAVRAANPNVPQIEVDYDAIDRDWRREMTRIYDFLGLPLTQTVEARMNRYVEASARQPHRQHRYSLSDFGISTDELLAA